MAGYLVFNFTKKIVILGSKYMNFLPIPISIKLSVSCLMLTSYPVRVPLLFAYSAIISISYSLSLLKLQLLILTTLSSLHSYTLKTHFKNKAKEQQNQNSLLEPDHSSSSPCSPLRAQFLGNITYPGSLCLSTLHSRGSLMHARLHKTIHINVTKWPPS